MLDPRALQMGDPERFSSTAKANDISRPLHLRHHRALTGRAGFVVVVAFEKAVDVLICVSALLLFFRLSHRPNGPVLYFLNATDVIFVFLLFLELFVRVSLYARKKLIRDVYFQIDLVVLAATLCSLVFAPWGWEFLVAARVLRLFRVLARLRAVRILVAILRWVVFRLLFGPITLLLVTWFVFGVIGLHFFHGRLNTCSLGGAAGLDRAACLAAGGTWERVGVSFDRIRFV